MHQFDNKLFDNIDARCNHEVHDANQLPYLIVVHKYIFCMSSNTNPYPTAFPYGNGMVLHFYQQQESSTTKTVHKVIKKGLKAYV